jgi:hypothetical protein
VVLYNTKQRQKTPENATTRNTHNVRGFFHNTSQKSAKKHHNAAQHDNVNIFWDKFNEL